MSAARAAEYGTGPWVKGYTDIFGGVLPSQPGFYFRTDAYHYNGSADTTIFDGRIALDVDQEYTATLFALSYVTPWKILGGTYAVAVVPSVVAMNVDVGIQIPAFTGPRGRTFGPFDINLGDTEFAQGDTAFAPVILGWDAGNLPLEYRRLRLCPDRRIQQEGARQYQPQSLGGDAAARRDLVRSENGMAGQRRRDLLGELGESRDRLRDRQHPQSRRRGHQEFRAARDRRGQLRDDPDDGRQRIGGRLGSFESRVYGVGPIVSFTTSADPSKALTVLAKWYSEFDAEHTFEGNTFDVAVSFKF